MASTSSIEWTDATWNPVTGCSKVSPGCARCYAERMAHRLRAMGVERYRNGFDVTLQEDLVGAPLRWRKPKMVFVNSMSDLFHDDVPDDFIVSVFKTMVEAHWHIFQVLTKRPERLLRLSDRIEWGPNIWMGVSVENRRYRSRIDSLREVPAAVRFLSVEPLLGPLGQVDLSGIHWVIVGGESGPGARPMKIAWAREVRDMCVRDEVPFFFKQWGGPKKSLTGRELDGRTWDDMPRGNESIAVG